MIVPMKKIALITQPKDAAAAIMALRQMGIAHVEHQTVPSGKDISGLREDLALIDAAIGILAETEFLGGAGPKISRSLEDWRPTAGHIVSLRKHLDQLEEYSRALLQHIREWEEWGDFEPQEIERLKQKNIFLRLCQATAKELDTLPAGVAVKKIKTTGNIINCALISHGRVDLPFKEINLPKMGLGRMQQRLAADQAVVEGLKAEIRGYKTCNEDFIHIRQAMQKELEFAEVLSGMGQAEGLAYLAGYIPKEREPLLLATAKKEKWGIIVSDPTDTDNVPTLIRTAPWVSLIQPVFKLLEVVPGYRELDISPVFLLFLALFFGMIIGDAGYGAVYFALTFLVQRKYFRQAKDKTPFFLFYLFSFCAMGWGLLTGTVFGQQWYQEAGFKALLPALNNVKVIMNLCFFIGAAQLSIGHGWQALVKLPAFTALADIGFICLLWVGFFLAKMFILGELFPPLGKWLAWTGIILIILFISPQKNLLKTIGAGLGNLALGLMGNFGDVVSYIRLFAVGLAGVAVADSVNILAAGSGNIVAQVTILFIGHTINMVLGPMSVLVHGIRLNVLEFSLLHGNVTWSGTAYKPLKE